MKQIIIGLTILLLVVTSGVIGFNLNNAPNTTNKSTPESNTQTHRENIEEVKHTSKTLTAEEVVKSYTLAKTWEDRYRHVADEHGTLEAVVKAKYSGHLTYIKREIDKTQLINKVDKRYLIVWIHWTTHYINGEIKSHDHPYYVIKINNEYKIDWEASLGRNKLDFDALKVQKPSEPLQLRAIVKMSNYYSFEFQHLRDTHYSIELRDPSDESNSLYGFVEKETEDGKKIYKKLKHGKFTHMTLAIRYPSNSISNNKIQIDSMVSHSWFIPSKK